MYSEYPICTQSTPTSSSVQGGIGNCWLMSTLACLAEFEGTLAQVFGESEASRRGARLPLTLGGESEQQYG